MVNRSVLSMSCARIRAGGAALNCFRSTLSLLAGMFTPTFWLGAAAMGVAHVQLGLLSLSLPRTCVYGTCPDRFLVQVGPPQFRPRQDAVVAIRRAHAGCLLHSSPEGGHFAPLLGYSALESRPLRWLDRVGSVVWFLRGLGIYGNASPVLQSVSRDLVAPRTLGGSATGAALLGLGAIVLAGAAFCFSLGLFIAEPVRFAAAAMASVEWIVLGGSRGPRFGYISFPSQSVAGMNL